MAPGDYESLNGSKEYDAVHNARITLAEVAEPYAQGDVHHVPDVGNKPSFVYILRGRTWQG